MRGFCGIGIYMPKHDTNIGTLWRSASNFQADFIFTIGREYRHQASDTLKAFRHIPLWHFSSFEAFRAAMPRECKLVGVEQSPTARDLKTFTHPARAAYLLGAEDTGIPAEVLGRCWQTVAINTPMCLNVAVAGSIVLFSRSSAPLNSVQPRS